MSTPTFIKFKSLTLLVLLIAWTSACAEREIPQPVYQKVTPDEVKISKGHMQPHTIRYMKSGKVMNYSVDATQLNGQAAMRVNIDFNQEPAAQPDQIWIDRATHAFRKRLLSMPAYTIEVAMDQGHFGGALTPAEGADYSAVKYDKQYPHDAFEPAIINYAIAALPLDEGYTASIPVFDLNNGSEMFWSNIKVLGRDRLNIDGVEFETWKVESDGIRKKTIWIDQATRLAIKMKTAGNFGAWKIDPASMTLK